MTAQAIADLFHARSTGCGRWTARCPAHEDREPSLSIREGQDGRVLLHCFGGCSLDSILAAAGLSVRDLFSGEPPTPQQRALSAHQQQAQAAQQHQKRQAYRSACERVRKLEAISNALAAKLARTPDNAPDGDALSRLFHETQTHLRSAERALEARL